MKKRLPEMQRNIADGLGIDLAQVHVKVSSMDGHDEIAKLEGVEARVTPRFLNILGDVSGLVTLDAGCGLRDHSLHLRS